MFALVFIGCDSEELPGLYGVSAPASTTKTAQLTFLTSADSAIVLELLYATDELLGDSLSLDGFSNADIFTGDEEYTEIELAAYAKDAVSNMFAASVRFELAFAAMSEADIPYEALSSLAGAIPSEDYSARSCWICNPKA